jgi:hypothetical protein
MLTFSSDPQVAESQMQAVIFLMTTFGYIDGDFDQREREFVRDRIRSLVKTRVDGAKITDTIVRGELVDKFTSHFQEVFEQIDARVRDLTNEPVAAGEDPSAFVHARLKQQCLELMQGFDKPGQEALMGAIDELLMADGEAHPAEVKFRGELAGFLEADLGLEIVEDNASPHEKVTIEAVVELPPAGAVHPFFEPFEHHYRPDVIEQQIEADLALIDRAMRTLEEQRAQGKGKLDGKKSFTELAGEEPFLDGHVYVVPPKPGKKYELLVLGDLHGCYSVLKAALLQSGFFDKVNAYRADPTLPEPHLVLLGDYIDRGLFSLNGVLRTVLQLLVTAPEFVHVLRGNHEYYIEHEGKVYGGVQPAEAINTLKPYVEMGVFKKYIELFEALPNSLSFGSLFFVHGGIPKDRLVKERWKDLSSLNDPDIRFQMMWSDPSKADVIPADLQDKSSRFAFGKLQFRAFMQRIGARTLVRGHEKYNEGFNTTYDGEEGTLLTLFSSGGKDNDDLPADSSYRTVTPMALTIRYEPSEGAGVTFTPWAPDYRAYNDPERNGFFKVPPEIPLRAK